jgi:hypothetical protein
MMRKVGRWLAWSGASATGCALVLSALGLTPAAAQTGPVSPVPASGTPALATTGTTEQVHQLVQCGGTMYAVGNFTAITWNGTTYTRNGAFSFSATSPFTMTSWNPDVNGIVSSIQLTTDCSHAYLGGEFTSVNGTSVSNIAEVDTTAGAVVSAFGHSANKQVNTLLLTPNGHLLAGGDFTSINGSSAHQFYASLNPATGSDDGYLNLNISGHYVYQGVGSNTTSIWNQQLSPDGGHVLVEGTFTKVESTGRQQIFMINLGTHGNVSDWYSTEFNGFCADKHPFYIKAAAFSPDGTTVYVADTGFHALGWKSGPQTGLCDAVAAFPSTRASGLSHRWINYTGCDSYYSVAADASAVYVGGHERWADNQNGCNNPGPGSVPAPGLGAFTPGLTGGTLLENSGGTAGLYSRGRGFGADDMLVTVSGLWVASDNFEGTNTCGGVSGFAGICFLPYSS